MSYVFHLLVYLAIYALAATSLNIVVGYCGLLSMAHAGYFALGSYTYALATLKLGWGFGPSALLAAAIAATFSLLLSLPAWRFRGDAFVLISLCVQVVLFSAMYNWFDPGAEIGSLRNLTNGSFGISGVPKPSLFGTSIASLPAVATLALMVAGAGLGVARLLLSSPWGRLLKAIRDDEVAARALGKRARLAKIQAFALSGALIGLSGALYATYVTYVDPSTASLDQSILMLCMVIIGGAGNTLGPIVGSLVLLAIPELLRFVRIEDALAANLRLLLFGALIVVIMRLRPWGLAGEYRYE